MEDARAQRRALEPAIAKELASSDIGGTAQRQQRAWNEYISQLADEKSVVYARQGRKELSVGILAAL